MVIEGRESLCKSRMYSIFVALNAYNGAYNRKNGGIEAPLETTPTCNFLSKDCNIQTSYKYLVRTYVCTKRRILIDESSPSKIIRIFILTRLKVVPSFSSRTVAFSFGWFLLLLSVPGKLIKTQGEEGTANTRIELVHNSRVSYSVPRLDRVKRISLISGG